MLSATILFLLLFILFSGIIYAIIRKQNNGLSLLQVVVFFGSKVAGGCLYGCIYKKFYGGDDTWTLNHDALFQYDRLIKTPGLFFHDLFTSNPIGIDFNLIHGGATYTESLEIALETKLLALFNFISHGNYYINIIFFNFLGFWGLYFLYKLMNEIFPGNKKAIAAIVFLFPPALFWLSGLRGEGYMILFAGILLYYFNQLFKKPAFSNILFCIISLSFIFILRDGFALLLIPALTGWWLSNRFNIKKFTAFGAVYAFIVIIIIASWLIQPAGHSLLSSIVKRQHDFMLLHGNTKFNLDTLNDNPSSFLRISPQAITNTLLRPFIWEANGLLQWAVSIESLFVFILLILAISKYRQQVKAMFAHSVTWALLFISVTNYFLIGFIVPFPGAIVRYRIIPEILLVCVAAIAIVNGMNKKNAIR